MSKIDKNGCAFAWPFFVYVVIESSETINFKNKKAKQEFNSYFAFLAYKLKLILLERFLLQGLFDLV